MAAQATSESPGTPVQREPGELKNSNYEAFIVALSILSVANIFIGLLIRVPDVANVINVTDALLSFIFLGDFLYRLFTARTKRAYFVRQLGWLDLLSSLPFPQAKLFRLFRVFRVVRLLRESGFNRFVQAVLHDRAGSALLIVLFLIILLLEFGSTLMLAIELRASDGNIKSAGDAIWYTYVTVTTVGYGDRYPVTDAGRVMGMVIMTIGVGLFGTLTGFLANAFVKPVTRDGNGEQGSDGAAGDGTELKAELVALRRQLAMLHERLDAAGIGRAPVAPPGVPPL